MMNLHGGNGPRGGGIPMNVDLSKIDPVECIKCKNPHFLMSGQIRMVNPIVSQSGKWDMAVNAEWRCANCGWAFKVEEWQQHKATEVINKQGNRADA